MPGGGRLAIANPWSYTQVFSNVHRAWPGGGFHNLWSEGFFCFLTVTTVALLQGLLHCPATSSSPAERARTRPPEDR